MNHSLSIERDFPLDLVEGVDLSRFPGAMARGPGLTRREFLRTSGTGLVWAAMEALRRAPAVEAAVGVSERLMMTQAMKEYGQAKTEREWRLALVPNRERVVGPHRAPVWGQQYSSSCESAAAGIGVAALLQEMDTTNLAGDGRMTWEDRILGGLVQTKFPRDGYVGDPNGQVTIWSLPAGDGRLLRDRGSFREQRGISYGVGSEAMARAVMTQTGGRVWAEATHLDYDLAVERVQAGDILLLWIVNIANRYSNVVTGTDINGNPASETLWFAEHCVAAVDVVDGVLQIVDPLGGNLGDGRHSGWVWSGYRSDRRIRSWQECFGGDTVMLRSGMSGWRQRHNRVEMESGLMP